MVVVPFVAACVTSGALVVITLYFGTRFIVIHSGSPIAKLSIKQYSKCLSYKVKYGVDHEKHTECMQDLQVLVKYLIDTKEINFDKCVQDKVDNIVGYCQVWVWYIPRKIILTDKALVDMLIARKNPVNEAPIPDVNKLVPSPERAKAKPPKSKKADVSETSESETDEATENQKPTTKKIIIRRIPKPKPTQENSKKGLWF